MVHNFADDESEINGREEIHEIEVNVTVSNPPCSTPIITCLTGRKRNSGNMLMECRLLVSEGRQF